MRIDERAKVGRVVSFAGEFRKNECDVIVPHVDAADDKDLSFARRAQEQIGDRRVPTARQFVPYSVFGDTLRLHADLPMGHRNLREKPRPLGWGSVTRPSRR